MAALPDDVITRKQMTVEEYLAFERASETKHEYIDGEIVAMTGAKENHNLVAGSTYATLYAQLRQRPCKVYPSDMRVKTGDGQYTYPDIIAVCGEAAFEDDERDTLLNPTVIIEVLSPSTEKYDRGKKFQHYRTMESLQEYLLIAQDSVHIEHYVRQGEQWVLTDFASLDAIVMLPSVDCTLALSDVYEKVSFEPEEKTNS
ncbi:MAG: Uma2 family endonuclease [Chloroflexi bacterium]|nr:Uma2 family endonuclease [Chloroflexota bacterium]MDL1885788.1 Uma2 family endonuclease [Anaerolineae bacterium CFX8]